MTRKPISADLPEPLDSLERWPSGPEEPRDRELRVAEDDAGGRLDAFLARALDLSRSQVRRLLSSDRVELIEEAAGGGDARSARPVGLSAKGLLLDAGLIVAVRGFRRPEDERPAPDPSLEVAVLKRGAGWLAVDKPAGAPVHPLRPDETGTVIGALVASEPGLGEQLHGVGEGGLRSGVVHRLDVDTSGVLLVATEEEAWQRIRLEFREHRVAKRYRALVHGAFEAEGDELALECPLVVASHRPARVRVCAPETRGAVVTRQRVRTVERLAGGRATLVEVDLETGFLHQIRATLAERGHPVIGDPTYANHRENDQPARELDTLAGRQMLHCARIAIAAIDDLEAECADPKDFAGLLETLRSQDSTC